MQGRRLAVHSLLSTTYYFIIHLFHSYSKIVLLTKHRAKGQDTTTDETSLPLKGIDGKEDGVRIRSSLLSNISRLTKRFPTQPLT